MQLLIVGAGYVGLTAAAVFADQGNLVTVLEKDPARTALLATGIAPFREPGLDSLLAKGISGERLRVANDIGAAIEGFDGGSPLLAFVAVGTPPDRRGGTDETELRSVARELANAIAAAGIGELILAFKSTVSAPAAERAAEVARSSAPGLSVLTVINPEFLRAGSAVRDFTEPDRVVVGGSDARAVELVAGLYERFVPRERILRMGGESAALVKYAANAMLATRISFMNEMAALASATGADIEEVRIGIGADRRIGADYLAAGIGFGGSCLPKDLSALIAAGEEQGVELGVARAVLAANERQSHLLLESLAKRVGPLPGRHIAVWGLAFKGGTDDLRSSPGVTLVNELAAAGARITAYEPSPLDRAIVDDVISRGVEFATSLEESLRGAAALVITTDCKEFRDAAPARIASNLEGTLVVDGRNLFDPKAMRAVGLHYIGVGRGEAP